jgi:hypothetical protein
MEYADFTYYTDTFKGTVLTADNADHFLQLASRQANNMTRGRISGIGFDNLSLFRQLSIQDVVCEQAEFLYQNEDVLQTYLQQYSINGVSMSFGQNWNLHIEGGTAMPESTYQTLVRTGLCYAGLD